MNAKEIIIKLLAEHKISEEDALVLLDEIYKSVYIPTYPTYPTYPTSPTSPSVPQFPYYVTHSVFTSDMILSNGLCL